MGALRDRFEATLRDSVPGLKVVGDPSDRLAGHSNLAFPGIDGDDLLKALPDVCASTAAACTSASLERSHVLRALGHDPAAVVGSVRFSLGRTTTEEEVDRAVRRILDGFQRIMGA